MGEAEGYPLLPEVCALAVSYGHLHTNTRIVNRKRAGLHSKLEHKALHLYNTVDEKRLGV